MATTTTRPGARPAECPAADTRIEGRGLWTVSADGPPRQLVDAGTNHTVRYTAWSPDGTPDGLRRIGGSAAIGVVDVEGRVSHPAGADGTTRQLAWTADGRSLLYVLYDEASKGVEESVRVVPVDGGEPKTLWKGRATTFGTMGLAGLPDGRVVSINDDGLFVVEPDGTGLRRLADVGPAPDAPYRPELPAIDTQRRRGHPQLQVRDGCATVGFDRAGAVRLGGVGPGAPVGGR